jgi:hypothetical protein
MRGRQANYSAAHSTQIGGSARGYQAEGFASSALVSASFGRGSVGQLEYLCIAALREERAHMPLVAREPAPG